MVLKSFFAFERSGDLKGHGGLGALEESLLIWVSAIDINGDGDGDLGTSEESLLFWVSMFSAKGFDFKPDTISGKLIFSKDLILIFMVTASSGFGAFPIFPIFFLVVLGFRVLQGWSLRLLWLWGRSRWTITSL